MTLPDNLKAEITECLRRSGYLLESRIVRTLSEARFFVEPNIAVIDRRTGKSRELDIRAEYFDYQKALPDVYVTTYFQIEVVNNLLPVVLMTPQPWSPQNDLEGYLRYRTTPDPLPFLEAVDLFEEKVGFNMPRYSQYCGLTRKKGSKGTEDLMASHPEDLYSSLLKLAESIDEECADVIARERSDDDPFWRLSFWQALLVVGGDLLIATEDDSGLLQIVEVDEAPLVFNYHVDERPASLLVHFVREPHLLSFLEKVLTVDHHLRTRMFEMRSSVRSPAT